MIYKKKGDFNKALEYLKKTLTRKIDKRKTANTEYSIGNIYVKLGQNEEALEYFNHSLILSNEIDSMNLMQKLYKSLSELFEIKSEYKKAIEHFELYLDLKEKLFFQERNKKISEMEKKYEIEEMEKEAEINKLKNVELAGIKQGIKKSFKRS